MNTKRPATQKTTTDEKSPATKTKSAAPPTAELLPDLFSPGEAMTELSGLPGSRPFRQSAVLQAQRQHGNAFVQRYLAQREETDDNAPLDTAGIGQQEELPGHGNLGMHALVQRENGSTAAPTPAAPAGPTATINLTVNAPTIVRSPEADISAAHSTPGVAGWCTPRYNIAPTSRTATTLGLNVTLDFTIELATEYTGDRLSVLSDHENGHVRIGERLARQHLVDDLKTNLQTLPNFASIPSIQAHLNTAGTAFTTAEGTESRAYDTADYPRMREAYFGARTPLPDLAAASPPIQHMIDALHAFNTFVTNMTGLGTDETGLENVIQGLIHARTPLSTTDMSRLQYNPEFKTLVATSQNFVAGLRDHVDEAGRVSLHEAELVLGSFTWSPPV